MGFEWVEIICPPPLPLITPLLSVSLVIWFSSLVGKGPHFLCWFLGPFYMWHIYISQAEKKINAVTSWATDKMTFILIQNDKFDNFEWNCCHSVHLLSFYQYLFSSQLEICHVLNGQSFKNQHRKWGP